MKINSICNSQMMNFKYILYHVKYLINSITISYSNKAIIAGTCED